MGWSWQNPVGSPVWQPRLPDLLHKSYESTRQQLREWCYDAADKKGSHRQEVDVTLCFAPRLALDCEPVAC